MVATIDSDKSRPDQPNGRVQRQRHRVYYLFRCIRKSFVITVRHSSGRETPLTRGIDIF